MAFVNPKEERMRAVRGVVVSLFIVGTSLLPIKTSGALVLQGPDTIFCTPTNSIHGSGTNRANSTFRISCTRAVTVSGNNNIYLLGGGYPVYKSTANMNDTNIRFSATARTGCVSGRYLGSGAAIVSAPGYSSGTVTGTAEGSISCSGAA
jgi:hypothetical protein